MTSLRQRVGFIAANDDDDDDGHRIVLDEVEQEAVIDDLRQRNTETTARALLLLDGVLAFSAVLQIVYLLKDSKASPLLALFPASTAEPDPPCPTLFALLALALHANLALLLHPNLVLRLYPLPLSYSLSYALSAVAPLAVAVPRALVAGYREGDEALAELETLQYRAPGP
ncbi:hypothetical protein B0H14DRAFT_3497246 [Mycena olivaceomarginata]|nr:hypothetical protein B0H14DRAFT_3497246 [Mycena olivaceomarginata]